MWPQQRNSKGYKKPSEARRRKERTLSWMRVPSQNSSSPRRLTQFCPLPLVPPSQCQPCSCWSTLDLLPILSPFTLAPAAQHSFRFFRGLGSCMALGILMAPGDRAPPGPQGNTPARSPLPQLLPPPLTPRGIEAVCLRLRAKETLTGWQVSYLKLYLADDFCSF